MTLFVTPAVANMGRQRAERTLSAPAWDISEYSALSRPYGGAERNRGLPSKRSTSVPTELLALAQHGKLHPGGGVHSVGGGLAFGEAVIVQFLLAMGAGVALSAWYPNLCGYALFPAALLVTMITATVSSAAILRISVQTGATTFADLCTGLPRWMKRLSEVCNVVWFLTLITLYNLIMYNALNDQIFAKMGTESWPHGRAMPGEGRLEVSVIVFAGILLATTPTNFGGRLAQLLNVLNLLATSVTVILGIVKGLLVAGQDLQGTYRPSRVVERLEELPPLRPEGFIQVVVLVAMSMCGATNMPLLNNELRPSCRQQAIWGVPASVAAMQGLAFLLVGTVGFIALGESVEGDAFKLYAAHHPNAMSTVLQMSLAFMVYLSTPLNMLPAKSQVWSFVTELRDVPDFGIDSAPAVARHSINFFCGACC
eukprot:TRINITY_DN34744_c0_g1_i10.p1 TRINITY_DN34744_c0_g1~~TRINITY_DN34744_c0_g1_i10.p1  ORF type:complete len:426 (-),score=54.02 TRINITY_DN34744_c0_g1_i10:622-1899(-)